MAFVLTGDSKRFFQTVIAYMAYFGSRYVGNDIQVLCGNIFDNAYVKTFTLFCIMMQAAEANVTIALIMTICFLFAQYLMSRSAKCRPYADKTIAKKIDAKPLFWPTNADEAAKLKASKILMKNTANQPIPFQVNPPQS